MPDLYAVQAEPAEILAEATQTNATCTATKVINNNQRAHVMGVIISANGAPAAGVTAEYRLNGVRLFDIQLPAAAHFPLFIPFTTRGLLHPVGADVEFSVPAYNVGIKVSVQIVGHVVGR